MDRGSTVEHKLVCTRESTIAYNVVYPREREHYTVEYNLVYPGERELYRA